MATTTIININIDQNLQFSVSGTRIGDNDSIKLLAEEGLDVTLQLLSPINFGASHDEKGSMIRWTPVTSALAAFAAQHTFPCPRSPFTLTVTTSDATAAAKTSTKKVKIEAGAAGGTKKPGIAAPGQQK